MIGDSEILISDIFLNSSYEIRSGAPQMFTEWHVTGSCEVKTGIPNDLSWHARVTKQKSFLPKLLGLSLYA